jgi:hypothetical protein
MKRSSFIVFALLAGCAPSFELTLPDRFVELRDGSGRGSYELRATTPDGVVVGLEVIDNDHHGPLDFWTDAARRRVRDQQGYALLSEAEIEAANGQSGHIMRFGRDLNGHTYRYTMALFVTEDRIWLIEAGGREEAYTAVESQIETSISGIQF